MLISLTWKSQTAVNHKIERAFLLAAAIANSSKPYLR